MYKRFMQFLSLHKLKFAISILGVYFVYGSIGNMLMPINAPSPGLLNILVPIFILTLYSCMIFSILGLGATIEQWGFTLDQKASYSIGLGIVLLFFMAGYQGFIKLPEFKLNFFLAILAASAEEFYMRVLSISILLKLLGRSKYKGWWAVIGSSVIFTIPHFFLQGWSFDFALANGLFAGLIFGLTYYHTRSIFFPLVAHVTFNTGKEGGILGGLLVMVVYFTLVLGKRAVIKYKSKEIISTVQISERE